MRHVILQECSISLAQSLITKHLIDEYRLVFCPVVLGAGRPLFSDTLDELDMTLVDTTTHDLGAVQLKYTQNGEPGQGPAPRARKTKEADKNQVRRTRRT